MREKMGATVLTYELLEERLTRWAFEQPAIRAGLVVGSRARSVPAPDEWSDLDLVLFVNDLEPYLRQSTWFEPFGEVWMAYLDTSHGLFPEWFILYAGGIKLDVAFSLLPQETASVDLARAANAAQLGAVIGRGMRVLFAKDGLGETDALASGQRNTTALPDQERIEAAIQRAFFTALNVAKFIRRGDLWRAKQRCDGDLKKSLLEMLEWQALSAHPGEADVWFEGRDLERWIAPQLAEQVPAAFAAYRLGDVSRALWVTLDLFHAAAKDTAGRLGYPYPSALDGRIRGLIQGILSG